MRSRYWYGEESITELTHPQYDVMVGLWDKYTLTYEGGYAFMEEYLEKFSEREDEWDFNNRRKISYVPAFAKSSINEIVNAIFQRMIDIVRRDGTPSYMNAIKGEDKGVDRHSRTMNNFIGSLVLPQLLTNGKVGVFIDMPRELGNTQVEQMGKNPYIYTYSAQDIRNWAYDIDNNPEELRALLLREFIYEYDEVTNLPKGIKTQYKYFDRVEGKVRVQTYDDQGKEAKEPVILDITRIPFVVLELSQSLLTDVADYQVALLNLCSADMNYSFKSNFPFYVEQYDPRRISGHIRQNYAGAKDRPINPSDNDFDALDRPGTQAAANISKPQEIVTGATRGRRYPIGTEPPAYIHPSPEPLRVSMEKQEQIKKDIKLLINLALSNLVPRKQISAESRAMDEQSLEAGLSYVGQELQHGETRIAEYWAMYENSNKKAKILYPTHYTIKSDNQRLEESEKLSKLRSDVPSITYQKEVSKQIANTLLSDKIPGAEMRKIEEEINNSIIPITDSDTLAKDIEQGLLSAETASKAKGYPEGEVEKAEVEHSKRAARIVAAQTRAAARGVPDLDADPNNSAKDEKTESQKIKDQDVDVKDKTRGEAK